MSKKEYLVPDFKIIENDFDETIYVDSILIDPNEQEHQNKAEGKRHKIWDDV